MASFLRKLVSQNKVRIKQDGFDLDLTYLTDQIICMGLPAVGSEALYRNPIDSVVRFLELKHKGKYKVFNLCNERSYDISKFGGACASFPFDDHGAPPLALVVAFCKSAKAWLLTSLDHVVVVHCKAGKGRTGLMSSCLALHLGYERTAADSISFYNKRRTKDGRGLTVPSQRRYVYYYERLLAGVSFDDIERVLCGIQMCGVPARYSKLLVRVALNPSFDGEPPSEVVVELDPRLPAGATHSGRCRLPLSTDVRVGIADEHGHELCRMWIHPALEAAKAVFVLDHDKLKSEIDVVDKGALPDGFTIALSFDVHGSPALLHESTPTSSVRDSRAASHAALSTLPLPPPLALLSVAPASGASESGDHEVGIEPPAYGDNYEAARGRSQSQPVPSSAGHGGGHRLSMDVCKSTSL